MDQGQWIEITGRSNAAYLRDVVLPRAEQRAAWMQTLRAHRETSTDAMPAWRAAAAWLGDGLVAVRRWMTAARSAAAGGNS